MSKMKDNQYEHNSFVLYKDSRIFINRLNKEQRGDLLAAIFLYVCDGEILDFNDDGMVQMCFEIIKSYLDRDERFTQADVDRIINNRLARMKQDMDIADTYRRERDDARRELEQYKNDAFLKENPFYAGRGYRVVSTSSSNMNHWSGANIDTDIRRAMGLE